MLRCGSMCLGLIVAIGQSLYAQFMVEPSARNIRGITRSSDGQPLAGVRVTAHSVVERTNLFAVSGNDGAFLIASLKLGEYDLTAEAKGYASSSPAKIELTAREDAAVDLFLAASVPVQRGFFRRWAQAYLDDWHPSAAASTPAPAYRGYPAPESSPPYPFTVWPIGGTVNLGQPYTIATPLMTAIYGGSSGKAWEDSRIQIYGWANLGMNISTSHDGPYANAPAAYPQVANSVLPDQMTLYIERQPDTVQTDHFDWGFRFANLWGWDYRFTTAKGFFSQQLLNNPKPNGTIGNKYGYDPVMFYVDLYVPHVAQGMDLRVGRYISLPDIEAQLAPNNYTYTHSLLYTYDCYTQAGANATIKLSNHWTVQFGLSSGCDTAAWKRDAKVTIRPAPDIPGLRVAITFTFVPTRSMTVDTLTTTSRDIMPPGITSSILTGTPQPKAGTNMRARRLTSLILAQPR